MSFPLRLSARAIRRRACSALLNPAATFRLSSGNDTIFVFLVVLPSAIIASYLGAPPWVVFACLKCDQILKCFVAVVKINRYNWMKNLTRETNEV